jgi:hypothetical protein
MRRPHLSKTPSTKECVAYVEALTRWIGPGFHPDTCFREYVDGDGKKILTAATCRELEEDLGRARDGLRQAGIEIYAVALPVQRLLI